MKDFTEPEAILYYGEDCWNNLRIDYAVHIMLHSYRTQNRNTKFKVALKQGLQFVDVDLTLIPAISYYVKSLPT